MSLQIQLHFKCQCLFEITSNSRMPAELDGELISPDVHALEGLRVGAQGKIVPKLNSSKCWNKTF